MIYGNGGVLGYTPREVNGMTPYEFSAAVKGWQKAHGAGSEPEITFPTEAEFYAAMARHA